MLGRVAKSAKFHTCSPTTASIRSTTQCDIASSSTWYSSVHTVGRTLCGPGCVSALYSVMMIGLSSFFAHASSSASSRRSAAARSAVSTYQP
jgi:hypothetical protein